ncbi:MAG: hypothetical protein V3S58_04650 [Nitrosomonadaceae bacterium]
MFEKITKSNFEVTFEVDGLGVLFGSQMHIFMEIVTVVVKIRIDKSENAAPYRER